MKAAVECFPSAAQSVRLDPSGWTGYDPTKHNLGPVIFAGVDAWTGIGDPFVGPCPIQVGRPVESSIATAAGLPHAIKITNTKWLIALADISTAATLRKFLLYEFNVATATLNYIGAISFTFPTAATIRGIRLTRTLHTTGTVAVSGTTVTGTGTNWLSRRVNAGSRIGFGSADPNAITNWYDITPGTAISSETSMTLTNTPGTIAAGTPYVIEDYALVIVATCATTTDGGLRVIKGLNPNTTCWSSTATATAISLGTTIDNIRACYWLKDAATITNTIAAGLALDDPSGDNLTQDCYVLDGATTTAKFFKYNIRKALTLTAGVDTTAYQLATGAPTTVGNVSQAHNCRIGTLQHGPGAGVKCVYFSTTTRLYRCPLTAITSGSTTFLTDAMLEIPPGGTNTLPATAAMSNLEIFDSLDRIGWFSSGATAFRSYVTQYRTDSGQLDHIWLSDDKIQHAAVSDSTAYPYPSTNSTLMTSWGEGGLCVLARHGTTNLLNQFFVLPMGAHWGYQVNAPYNVYISPEIGTPNCQRFYRAHVSHAQQLGGDVLGVSPEGFRLYYRTGGITDNSGAWNLVPADGDIGGAGAASSIQFKVEFKILGPTCVPARIFSIAAIYETSGNIPSQLRWNMDDSSSTDGTMGFIQTAAFGGSVPTLTINYYRADNDANVLTQASTGSTSGAFQYWNGSAWTAGLGPDTVGTRRRFVPSAGLPNGVAVYAKLTT